VHEVFKLCHSAAFIWQLEITLVMSVQLGADVGSFSCSLWNKWSYVSVTICSPVCLWLLWTAHQHSDELAHAVNGTVLCYHLNSVSLLPWKVCICCSCILLDEAYSMECGSSWSWLSWINFHIFGDWPCDLKIALPDTPDMLASQS